MMSREESALLEEARFNTDEAKKQLDRVRELARRGAASQSELDMRIREYEAARARYLATEEARHGVVTTLIADVTENYLALRALDLELEIATRTRDVAVGVGEAFQPRPRDPVTGLPTQP